MPLSQQQNREKSPEGNGKIVHEDQYRALQHLPGFQNFRDQQAGVWSPSAKGFSSRTLMNGDINTQIADNRGDSLAYMTTEGIEFDTKGSSPTAVTSASLDSEATAVPEQMGDPEKRLLHAASDSKLNANTPVFEGSILPGLYATAGPTSGSSIDQKLQSPTARSFSDKPIDDSQGCKTPSKDPGFPTNTSSGRRVLYVPGSFAHHRRQSSRLSSLPSIPSPLGPRHYADDLGSDVSGLVSPLPHSPEQTRCFEEKVPTTPQKLDLHVLKVAANSVGSPYHRNKSGHDRKIADPFVEDTEKLEGLLARPSPFVAQAMQKNSLSPSQVQVPGTPAFQFPSSPVSQKGQNNLSSPDYQGFAHPSARTDFRVPGTPVFQPFQPTTPSTPFFQNFANPTPREDLPIPPPPLSSVQGQLHHNAETRALLDARAAIRADWIRAEAKKIAELSRQSFAAAQQFQQTGSKEDYKMWQAVSAAYDDATNLEKRQEERRNMFMPQGMTAMRTGAENVVGDQSVAFAVGEGQSESPNQGKLLGFQMAYMERITAEVKRREEERKQKEEEEVTMEMLNTLSLEEKKMLRKYLVSRLSSAASEREDE
jgi:hypothetical protein